MRRPLVIPIAGPVLDLEVVDASLQQHARAELISAMWQHHARAELLSASVVVNLNDSDCQQQLWSVEWLTCSDGSWLVEWLVFGWCRQVASGEREAARTSTSGMPLTGLLANMLSSCVCVWVCVCECVCVCLCLCVWVWVWVCVCV